MVGGGKCATFFVSAEVFLFSVKSSDTGIIFQIIIEKLALQYIVLKYRRDPVYMNSVSTVSLICEYTDVGRSPSPLHPIASNSCSIVFLN